MGVAIAEEGDNWRGGWDKASGTQKKGVWGQRDIKERREDK